MTGTLRLAFVPDAAVGVDDPAIQFETGGRNVTFVIQADTLFARFAGASQDGFVRFQSGTVRARWFSREP